MRALTLHSCRRAQELTGRGATTDHAGAKRLAEEFLRGLGHPQLIDSGAAICGDAAVEWL
jgi:hypothetical protein